MNEVAAALPRRHRLNRSEYYRMAEAGILAPDARVELIEGEIIDMPPIGSRHASTVALLLRKLIRMTDDLAIVHCQSPIVLGDSSEPEPDISLLRLHDHAYARRHPDPSDVLLVIEVADTTLAYDRDVKSRLYARAGIPEYWLVDLAGGSVLVHRHPASDGYRHITRHATPVALTLAALPAVTITLPPLLPRSD